jgi:hypothetical protein
MRRSVSVQIFTKGSVHAVVRLGKSTFKTRAVRAAPTVAWQETGMLYVRYVRPLTWSPCCTLAHGWRQNQLEFSCVCASSVCGIAKATELSPSTQDLMYAVSCQLVILCRDQKQHT